MPTTRAAVQALFLSSVGLSAAIGPITSASAQCPPGWVAGFGGAGTNADVKALYLRPSGDLLVGGAFTTAGGTNGFHRLVQLSLTTGTWSLIGTGVGGPSVSSDSVNGIVQLPDGDIFIVSSVPVRRAARFNVYGVWTELPGASATNNAVAMLPGIGANLLVGGTGTISTTQFFGHYLPASNGWVNPTWTFDGQVLAVAVLPSGDAVLGGNFLGTGSVSASNVVRYLPATRTFANLGTSTGGGSVRAVLAMPNGDVIIGGTFTSFAGVAGRNNVARYSFATNTWSALGAGTGGTVNALALLPDGRVAVGGAFTTAGGAPANRIAIWDPVAATWSALGSGLSGPVNALAVLPGGDLAVGGVFISAGGQPAGNIARYTFGAAAPVVTGQPVPVTTVAGASAVFAVTVTAPPASGPPSYLWRKDGVPLNAVANPSAATPVLVLTNVQAANLGSYDCLVTNACGGTATASNSAALAFAVTPTGCSPADLAFTDGSPGFDQLIDNGDFSLFFTAFFAGCP